MTNVPDGTVVCGTGLHPPLDTILRRSINSRSNWDGLEFPATIDPARWFVCPTLTPLYYAPIYRDLDEGHRRRYNQLTALCFNELIAFFEESFAASVLAAIADAHQRLDERLVACLQQFIREERQHIGYWRRLNRLTRPEWYENADRRIIRFSPLARGPLRILTSRPHWFPVVFWVMLALEERSLDISRRCLRMDPSQIEKTYRAVYQHHMQDEARHVQLDRYLIDRFYATLPRRWRRLNARLLAMMLGRLFLRPSHSAVRVARRLAAECVELKPQLPVMIRQLHEVGDSAEYHEMMYSRKTTPLTFALFDRFEEMHRMQHVLQSYTPHSTARLYNE